MTETALLPLTTFTVVADASGSTQNLGTVPGCVRLVSTVDCFVNFKSASAPTPATTEMFLPAYAPEYFNTRIGFPSDLYIGVITSSATGSLYATVMS